MSTRKMILGAAVGLAVGLTVLSGSALAQWDGDRPARTPDFSRFSITVGGGAALAENHQAMPQLLAELQYSLTTRFRLGLGVGYLDTDEYRGYERDIRVVPLALSQTLVLPAGSEIYAPLGGEPGRDFRLVPISLNAYYALPLARKWDIFLSGGASYYLGTFYADSDRQTKNAWGGQAGIGIEYRLNRRIKLVVQGDYRFVEFSGLKTDQTLNPLIVLANPSGPGSLVEIVLPSSPSKPVDVHLNGLSLTGGIRFGF